MASGGLLSTGTVSVFASAGIMTAMPRMTWLPTGLLATWVLLPASLARGSGFQGVRVRPSQVVLEPNAVEPLRIQIHGVVALRRFAADGYAGPACGYLYYQCPAGRESICRMKWKDLDKAVSAATCVAFGEAYVTGTTTGSNGRLRAPDEAPASPDPYPVNYGVATVPCQGPPGLTTTCAIPGGGAGSSGSAGSPDLAGKAGTGGTDGPGAGGAVGEAGGGGRGAPDPAPKPSSAGGCRIMASAQGPAVTPLGLALVAVGLARRRRKDV